MFKKQFYLTICLLSGITLNTYGQNSLEVPAEQKQSVMNNTYEAIKADIASIITLIKNNPVKTVLAAAAFIIIVGSIQIVPRIVEDHVFEDLRFLLNELRGLHYNHHVKIQEILYKLEALKNI